MTPQAQLEVLAAGSPLTWDVVTGPCRDVLVLAAFPGALYLAVGAHHEVLPVLASDALMPPTAVRLSAPSDEMAWGVEPGDRVTVGGSRIGLPLWQIRVVRQWRPARVQATTPLANSGQLAELADLLSDRVTTPELIDQAEAVCRAAGSHDQAGLRRGVRPLLGAGPGLTPSGDDALCAVLLMLHRVGDSESIALLDNAVRERWTATTSLSASLLDAAGQGYAVPDVVALVDSALRGDLVGTQRALATTLAIGHSSGQDLVAGLAGSLRALTSQLANARVDAQAQTCQVDVESWLNVNLTTRGGRVSTEPTTGRGSR